MQESAAVPACELQWGSQAGIRKVEVQSQGSDGSRLVLTKQPITQMTVWAVFVPRVEDEGTACLHEGRACSWAGWICSWRGPWAGLTSFSSHSLGVAPMRPREA